MVDAVFLKRIKILIKIVVPSWSSPVVWDLSVVTVFFIIRTFLSIYISGVNGKIVKSIVKYDQVQFMKNIGNLALLALPASFVNSYLTFLNKKIALRFRQSLTEHFHKMYIKDMIYYQMTNIDSRINNPDQRIAQDIEKWASTLSTLYQNLTKPVIDIVLFSRKLAEQVTWKGPGATIFWFFLSGFSLKFLSPPFGKMRAKEQILEGEYRSGHTDLLYFSEEVAFQNGSQWERRNISEKFANLTKHLRKIMLNKLYMGTIDHMLIRYAANIMGYTILGFPVFGDYIQAFKVKAKKVESATLTGNYINNSSLLINLSKVSFLYK